jgi:hypothetical protein
MKAAIVVTSIHDCTTLLEGYLKNFAKYGREATIHLITDTKTPAFFVPGGVKEVRGLEQVKFLDRIGFSRDDIPWNSDNRRNVGYLMALADGAEMIVSIDDDNYCPEEEDFLEDHAIRLLSGTNESISTRSGWFNNLTLFSMHPTYPRGFPYYARKKTVTRNGTTRFGDRVPVRINVGMWEGDPDLDAMTWVHSPYRTKFYSSSASLGADTWCPINSQNTAVHRDLMPAYYFIRMTSMMDRFGDIFQGYFALKVAKHMGWTARFGSPVVTHKRNSHVYLKDVQKEIGPILLLEELLPKLIEAKLTGTTVEEAYLSLAEFLCQESNPFYHETATLMRAWVSACRRIG